MSKAGKTSSHTNVSRQQPTLRASSRPNTPSQQPLLDSLPEDPVDRMLATDPVLIRLGREIRKHQGLLRDSCSEEAWRVYLRIEELINERMFAFADKWVEKNPRSSVHHNHLMDLRPTSKETE